MQTSPDAASWQERAGVPPISALAAELLKMPDVVDRLLARHVADRLGYCQGCELPQAGPMRWPCRLYVIADVARTAERTKGLPLTRSAGRAARNRPR